MINFPCSFQKQQIRHFDFSGHVRERKSNALKLTDFLIELLAGCSIIQGCVKSPLGPCHTSCSHGEARRPQPFVDQSEAVTLRTHHPPRWNAGVVEAQDVVGVAPVRDIAVTRSNLDSGIIEGDEESGNAFFEALGGFLLSGRREQHAVVRNRSLRDEMLLAADHPLVAIAHGFAFHATQIGTRSRLGHSDAVALLAFDGWLQKLRDLFALTGGKDVERTMRTFRQRQRGAA